MIDILYKLAYVIAQAIIPLVCTIHVIVTSFVVPMAMLCGFWLLFLIGVHPWIMVPCIIWTLFRIYVILHTVVPQIDQLIDSIINL